MQVKRHCAVKYRMYPNRAQAALIDRTIGLCEVHLQSDA